MGNLPVLMDADGRVTRPDSAAAADSYRAIGYTDANEQALKRDAIKTKYGSAWQTILAGSSSSIPGVTTAVAGAASALGYGKEVGDFYQGAEEANPGLYTFSQGLGTLATGAAAVFAAPALGLGALGAAGTAAVAAGAGAATGLAFASDEQMLQYAQTGEGSEKLYAELGKGALLGAVTNVAFLGAGKLVSKAASSWKGKAGAISQSLQEKALGLEAKSAIDAQSQAILNKLPDADMVKAYVKDNNLTSMAPAQVKKFLAADYAKAKGLMNEARFASGEAISLGDQQQLMSQLRAVSADMDPLIKGVIEKRGKAGVGTVRELQNLRMELDKKANFVYGDERSMYQRQISIMRDAVNDNIGKVLDAGNPQVARAWSEANRLSRASAILKDKFDDPAEGGALSSLFRLGAKSGAGAAAGAVFGGPVGAALGASAGAAIENGVLKKAGAGALRGLAKAFDSFDGTMADSVINGLTGKAASLAVTESLIPNHAYPQISARVKVAAQDPSFATEDLVAHLDKQGVPGQLIDHMIPRHMQAMSILETMRPKDPYEGQTVAPSTYTPTAQEQRTFMDAVNTIANPVIALKTPTPERIAILSQVYPELMAQTHAIVSDHAATSPTLGPAGRDYASNITGMPAAPSSLPQVRMGMAMLKQQRQLRMQMQAKQGGGGGSQGTRGGIGDMVNSSITRSERMSN